MGLFTVAILGVAVGHAQAATTERVVVDPKSLVYLRGSVLDYEIQLMQHGFTCQNPNEKSSCGCGESFSV